MNKIIKEHKIALPITKEGFKKVCKALDLHCSEMLALEGLLYCRGKQMEFSRPEDFDFDRMCAFLTMKSKIVAPASNPRIALSTRQSNHRHSFDFYPQLGATMTSMQSQNRRAPPSIPMMQAQNQAKRSLIRS